MRKWQTLIYLVVTTRRRGQKANSEEALDIETIVVSIPPRTPKRKAEEISGRKNEKAITSNEGDDEFYTPPTSKKPRVYAAKESVEQEIEALSKNKRLVVEIPAMAAPDESILSSIESRNQTNQHFESIKEKLCVRTRRTKSKSKTPDRPQQTPVSEAADQQLAESVKESSHTISAEELGRDVKPKITSSGHSTPRQRTTDEVKVVTNEFPSTANQRNQIRPKSNVPQTISSIPFDNRKSLPDLLPADLLEDDGPKSATELQETLPRPHSKKTKFVDITKKPPKDRRIGSSTYRISKPIDSRLAPRSSYQAQSTKESWLQGRPGKSGTTNRRPFSSGFFTARN